MSTLFRNHTFPRRLAAVLVLTLALSTLLPVASRAAEDGEKTPRAGVVNVNQASPAQLALLPRVGPAVADRIVAYREESGEFTAPEDLMLVRGIGDKTFDLLEPYVVVKGDTTLQKKVSVADARGRLDDGNGGGERR